MRSFVKGISDIDIKIVANQDLTSAIRSFSVLYVIVEEARCTKTEIENLESAKAKNVELQYYKNLAKKRLHFPSQPQVYNLWSNSLPSSTLKPNTKPSSNKSAGPTMENQNQF